MTVSSNPNYSKDRIFDKFMELYDINSDPDNMNNLAASAP